MKPLEIRLGNGFLIFCSGNMATLRNYGTLVACWSNRDGAVIVYQYRLWKKYKPNV